MFGLSDRALDSIRGVLSTHASVERAILYGSRAKGTERRGSDIDLTLKGAVGFDELLRIETELDDLLLPWMIDLSRYEQVDNPSLRDHIDRIGVEIYAKGKGGASARGR